MPQVNVKRDSSPMCVYIAARGHSGSTMLELLLNRFSGVAAVGEVDQLPLQIIRDGVHTRWEGLCSCGSSPINCEIWGDVIEQVSANSGLNLQENPFDLPISDIGLAQEYGYRRPVAYFRYFFHRIMRGFSHRLGVRLPSVFPYRNWIKNRDLVYRALANRLDVSTIVDASKDAMQMSDLVHYSELPVKVLFLTRDVRGNVWSAIRRDDASAVGEARDWAAVNQLILSRLEKLPESSWLQVKYEDLCANTDSALQGIFEFLGLESRSGSPEDEKARRHTIAGNQIRFRDLDTIRQDLAWRDNLSENQFSEIRRVAGTTARRLGYEI